MDVVADGAGLVATRRRHGARGTVRRHRADPGRGGPGRRGARGGGDVPGSRRHPFPECFACGTGREPGDGLRIFPGRVSDQDDLVRAAATWTPDESLHEDWHDYAGPERRASLPVTWAALDCVGAWAADMSERMMVLGRMTSRVGSLPVVGEEHVVVGLARGPGGRKSHTASSIYDSRGGSWAWPSTSGSPSTRRRSRDDLRVVAARRRLPGLPRAASPTPTATASATCPASPPGCPTCATSASTRSGSRRSTPPRRPTPATTLPTTATSTRCSAPSTTPTA